MATIYDTRKLAVAAAEAAGHDFTECTFTRRPADNGWTYEVLPEYLTDAEVEAAPDAPEGLTVAVDVMESAPAPVYDMPAPVVDPDQDQDQDQDQDAQEAQDVAEAMIHAVPYLRLLSAPVQGGKVMLVLEGALDHETARVLARLASSRLGTAITLRDMDTGATLETISAPAGAAGMADKPARGPSGRDVMLTLLQRPEGATKAQLMEAGGWHVQPDMKAFGKSKKCSISKEWTPAGFIYRAVYGLGIGALIQHDAAHRCTPDAPAPVADNDAGKMAEAAD